MDGDAWDQNELYNHWHEYDAGLMTNTRAREYIKDFQNVSDR